MVREWGRVGSPGSVRKDWFDTEEKALTARQRLVEAKQKKGYQSMGLWGNFSSLKQGPSIY
ncbi:WGR domain-containing protein [Candidatus Methylobacter favarea]|uniref:WGR domain-containing protein n=1 Tax=Candidatus Methylobacter favarea TaxID=2707345 RepID=UPI002483A6A8|nr:WGR domain-containing protein [Candidatus Methylobacter favarea]